jgi:hypothetical protein
MNCEDASAASAELQEWRAWARGDEYADRGEAGADQSAAASEAAQHSSDGMFAALRQQEE